MQPLIPDLLKYNNNNISTKGKCIKLKMQVKAPIYAVKIKLILKLHTTGRNTISISITAITLN